ncbi:MAG TPA: MBL fold metallo-hydrolase [Balneolaceae bacterium]|nr:MBL fold metallo-hydrolase [Balneolaceae bacterium]|tara:strand:- start:123494 stop:124384 length:891 start_codon:yes stop_codon:yes gene_type:complete
MKRRDFLRNTLIVGAGVMLPLSGLSASRRDAFTTLRRNVGFFTERGGTIGWLASDQALVAVDSQFPDSAAHCIAGLQEKTSHSMDLLINTHHHGDHTGGNGTFKEITEHIVAHKNVPVYQQQSADEGETPVVADITFETSWKQEVGDEIIHANHYGPAHTGGDAVVYFEKANVAHMGDLIFNRAYPYIDPGAGASVRNWVSVLDETLKTLPSDTLFIFGHANPKFEVTGTVEDIKVMRNYLEALITYTQKGLQAGKSKEELMNKEVLPGFEAFNNPDWFLKLSNNVEVMFNELITN